MNSDDLVDLAFVLNQQNDIKEIFRLVSQKAAQLLQAELSLVLMANPRTQQTVKTMHKEGVEMRHPRYRSLQNQVSGWVLRNNEPLLSPNLKKDARFSKVRFGDIDVKSVIAVPLTTEGIAIGVLILLNKRKKGIFNEEDLAFLNKIAIISVPYLRSAQKIQEYFETRLPDATLLARYEKLGLIGKSKVFKELLRGIEAAVRCDVRVLLEGESGTGKELVARAIHKLSERSQGPFIAIDCGAIASNLLESELFGHVRGAFTGATYDRKGLLEEANHGTLFMDEIANMPAEMQSKFMRVLQEKEIKPVGSNKSRKVDVRIITASSFALGKLVEKNKFREDLFYRLYVYPLTLPPLAQRREDIPHLANYFLNEFANQQSKKVCSFDASLLEFMKPRQWPGNIRELENFVERLVTIAPESAKTLAINMVPQDIHKEFKKFRFSNEFTPKQAPLNEMMAKYEEQILLKTLDECNWNQSKAARVLNISEQTIRYKITKLGIDKPS